MLISGFTFIRNAVKFDFPIRECVESMLPLVDELVINVGKSEDGTEEFIAQLSSQSPKIRIINSVWDDSKTDKGLVLSEQTNIALNACQGRWCLYLQADEALHESEHLMIRKAIEDEEKSATPTEGFRLKYFHFYGGYSLIQRSWNWYPAEIRIIRRDTGAKSFGDAQTFRGADDQILETKLLDAHIFHYGHARAPEVMKRKISYFHRFWHGDRHGIAVENAYSDDLKNLVWFWGTHPRAYATRVQAGQMWSKKSTSLKIDSSSGIVIFAESTSKEFAEILKKHLRSSLKQARVSTALGLFELLQVPASATIIDLAAEKRGILSFLIRVLVFRLKYRTRIADAPLGSLNKFRSKFYNFINWGTHETAALGFIVPEEAHLNQLGRWLGIEEK